MNEFPPQETTLLIPSPVGHLELLTAPPEAQAPKPITAIICHPHPLFAGSMHNKVVTTLKKVFSVLGLSTVRFNFRGIGKSTGEYGDTKGELEDLFAVIAWVKQVNPTHHIWLAGFSFGSYIAALASQQITADKLILVAPPVVNFPFADLKNFSSDVYVVQGEEDEVVDAAQVFAWVESMITPVTLLPFPETGHYFHSKLTILKDQLIQVLNAHPNLE